jgi:MauM/NapG family ferredoxin protein
VAFFKKLLSKVRAAGSDLRPPGAVAEEEFVKRCIKCNKCVQICPYDSILTTPISLEIDYGTPIVIPRDIPCYLCMMCPPVCPTGALDNSITDLEEVRMGLAVIDEEKCLPFHGVICRSCFERCPIYRKAITLRDEMYPVVHSEECVGCGICENVCPVEGAAIIIESAHDV